MRHNIRILLLIILAFSTFRCSPDKKKSVKPKQTTSVKNLSTTCDTNSKIFKIIDSYFHDLYKNKGFNGAVLISQNNKVIFKKAYGVMDFKTKTPLTTSTNFQLASVSKQFTAFAILYLYEKGLIRLEDSVQKFLPNFPYPGITIKNLLNHRSGLCNYIYFVDPVFRNSTSPMTLNQLMLLFEKNKPECYYSPNEKFSYNNTNYIILAAIIEKISAMHYDTFMKKFIFQPLGMNNTFVYNPYIPLDSTKTATGYEYRNKKAGFNYLDGVPGDKDIYTTVEDMFIWDQAWNDNKLISSQTLRLAFEPGSPELKEKNYGFGWRISMNEEGDTLVWHRGWWHGFRTYFMRNITKHDCIVILTNIASEKSHIKVKDLTDILSPHDDESIEPEENE